MNPASPLEQSSARVALLVSLRSLKELRSVADVSIDVLDFKEPRRGPLAAVSPELWHRAALEVQLHRKLSAALGEWDGAVQLAGSVPQRFAYAKAGPAGVQTVANLTASWSRIRRRLAPAVELVAVAYADHQRARCPEPEAIFQAAADAGMRTWLLDTFAKPTPIDDQTCICLSAPEETDSGDSIAQLGVDRLAAIGVMAQRLGAGWVLAGSVKRQAALELLDQGVRPTMFGVRGDLCEGSRGGQVVPAKVRRWLQILGSFAQEVNQGDDRQHTEAQT